MNDFVPNWGHLQTNTKMKKLLLMAACIATLMTSNLRAQDFAPKLKTIPIILEPVVSPWLAPFWAAVAAVGVLMEVEEAACEPLENFKIGIQHSTESMSASVAWPGGEYPLREFEAERVYDYNPQSNIAQWFIRTTFITYPIGGNGPIIERNYSVEPPEDQSFNNMDVAYSRAANPAYAHDSAFEYDNFAVATAYCYRMGGAPFPRPVAAIMNGWVWKPLWRNDYLYHEPVDMYQDIHYLMIAPWSVALYKPNFIANTELPDGGVVTTLFAPADW